LAIHIEYGDWKGNFVIPSKFKEVIKRIGLEEKKKLGEICFIFVSEKEILRINREFLKHDYVTDVITFGNNTKKSIGGDIFVCPQIVFLNAVDYGSDNYTELFRVMIHGVLHLTGYSDATVEQRSIMKSWEDFYLDYGKKENYLV
jgi:probable rRNA maturation factor